MTAAAGAERLALLSDEDLMRRVQADDIRAFEELYDRYGAKALGLARIMCGGSQRCDEALQDGFLALWRSRSSYDPARGGARTWLLMVIRHRCVDLMRRDRRDDGLRESDCQLEYLPAPDCVAEDAQDHDEARRLRASLRKLPAGQLEVIALAYFGGLSHTEIATRLQLPAGTVKGRMRLGLEKIRTEINPHRTPNATPDGHRLYSVEGFARIGTGITYPAPSRLTSTRSGARVVARGLGARDLVLGAGALAVPDPQPRPWVAAAILADTASLVATVAAGKSLPLEPRPVRGHEGRRAPVPGAA